jgi:hypothetical protein
MAIKSPLSLRESFLLEGSHLFHFRLPGLISGQALQLATPHEVHVKVKYHLPPIGVTVDLNPISACGYTFFLGEFTCLEGEQSQQLSLLRPGIVESRHVLLRNQEKVNRGFWVDVLKNQDLIVLVDHRRGNVT